MNYQNEIFTLQKINALFVSGVLNTDGDSYEEFAQDYNDMCEEEEMYEL